MTTCEICHNHTFEEPILGVRMCCECIRKVDAKIRDIGGSSFGFGWAYTRCRYASLRQPYFGDLLWKALRAELYSIQASGFVWQPDPDDSHPPLHPDDIPTTGTGTRPPAARHPVRHRRQKLLARGG